MKKFVRDFALKEFTAEKAEATVPAESQGPPNSTVRSPPKDTWRVPARKLPLDPSQFAANSHMQHLHSNQSRMSRMGAAACTCHCTLHVSLKQSLSIPIGSNWNKCLKFSVVVKQSGVLLLLYSPSEPLPTA